MIEHKSFGYTINDFYDAGIYIKPCSLNRPVDVDGVPINIGDTVYDIHNRCEYKVDGISRTAIWFEEQKRWIESCFVLHKYPDSYKKIIAKAIEYGADWERHGKWTPTGGMSNHIDKLVERCEKVKKYNSKIKKETEMDKKDKTDKKRTTDNANFLFDVNGDPIIIGETVYVIVFGVPYRVDGISKDGIWCGERGRWIESCFVTHKYPDSYEKILIDAIEEGADRERHTKLSPCVQGYDTQQAMQEHHLNELVRRCEQVEKRSQSGE